MIENTCAVLWDSNRMKCSFNMFSSVSKNPSSVCLLKVYQETETTQQFALADVNDALKNEIYLLTNPYLNCTRSISEITWVASLFASLTGMSKHVALCRYLSDWSMSFTVPVNKVERSLGYNLCSSSILCHKNVCNYSMKR